MVLTTRFKILILSLGLLILFGALVLNQWVLTNRLDSQATFDTKVMQMDGKIWGQLQKVASQEAKLIATPTPTPTQTPKLITGVKLTK